MSDECIYCDEQCGGVSPKAKSEKAFENIQRTVELNNHLRDIGVGYRPEGQEQVKGLTRETLGARLKKLRDEVHMEQEIVARVLSIPRTAVIAIEQGKRDLTAIELADLCKLYRISPNELLNWKSQAVLSGSGSEEKR